MLGAKALAALLLFWSAPALAWTPATRIRMADEAVRLMPPSLRLALEHHREALLRGVLEPMTAEDGAEHKSPADGGSLDAEVAARMKALESAVSSGKSFREIAKRLGALAHFVADATFPPNADPDGAPRYGHFGSFCESRQPRFPLVFYGHDDEDLQRGDDRGFARALIARAHAENALLAPAYLAVATPSEPAAFDDRSVPFAVGSLNYSWTVTVIVRAWLTGWVRAGGDLRGTPYLDSASVYRRSKEATR
jgi:hypothetical protein